MRTIVWIAAGTVMCVGATAPLGARRATETRARSAAGPQVSDDRDRAAFDVASVRRRGRGGPVVQMLMTVTPGRIRFQSVPLRDCLRWAYGVADYQLRGAPDWLEQGPHWDIEATTTASATGDQVRGMFRRLLADRFGLQVHRETEDSRVMLLTVTGPGPGLKPAADDAPRSDDWRRSPLVVAPKAGPGGTRIRELTAERATMRHLTEYLSRQFKLPVIDRTGLSGEYSLHVEWPADPETLLPETAPGAFPALPPPGQSPNYVGSAGMAALREQLGLTLVSGRAPVEMLVIDLVHEATDN
jgi:uncharacterized protein (TIGR03435 family)